MQAKELSLSLLGAWKDKLVTLQAEVGRALRAVLEGLKGLGGIGLFQKPKRVGRHKGRTRWSPKRRPKLQPTLQSSKVGVPCLASFPQFSKVRASASSMEVALLLVIALEEAHPGGLIPACPIDTSSFLFPPRPEARVAQSPLEVALALESARSDACVDGFVLARLEDAVGSLLPQPPPVALGLAGLVPGIPASTLGGLGLDCASFGDGAIPPVVQSTASSSSVLDRPSDAKCPTQVSSSILARHSDGGIPKPTKWLP
ncbi:hypothetical protein SLA2020_381450 [Shorea laevis]